MTSPWSAPLTAAAGCAPTPVGLPVMENATTAVLVHCTISANWVPTAQTAEVGADGRLAGAKIGDVVPTPAASLATGSAMTAALARSIMSANSGQTVQIAAPANPLSALLERIRWPKI